MSEGSSPGDRSGPDGGSGPRTRATSVEPQARSSGEPDSPELAAGLAGSRAGCLAVRTPAAGWVELTAPSREEYLERIASFLDTLAGIRLDEETREEVKLAVTEITSNAMEWGNRGDESLRVHVSYGLFDGGTAGDGRGGGELVFKIEDEGEGFDPASVPDPTVRPAAVQRERLASGKRMGGFGLLVARRVMDRVIYSERGNCVLLAKLLP